jgi:hypothetical protein
MQINGSVRARLEVLLLTRWRLKPIFVHILGIINAKHLYKLCNYRLTKGIAQQLQAWIIKTCKHGLSKLANFDS